MKYTIQITSSSLDGLLELAERLKPLIEDEPIVGVIEEKASPDVEPEPPVDDEAPSETAEEVIEEIEGDEPVEDIAETHPVEKVYETRVKYGVNFRNAPQVDAPSKIYRMLKINERIHVIKEVNENWLMVEVQDGTIGYVSANTKYTDYSLKDFREKKIDSFIAYGEQFIGCPYVFGAKIGAVNSQGQRIFDCSSFVKTVVQDVYNYTLPRLSGQQADHGKEIKKEDMQRGDLIFFSSGDKPRGHVGIYAGNDRVLHTYSVAGGGVKYTGFKGTSWEKRFAIARRIY